MLHQLGYIVHRANDRFVPHASRTYRVLDRIATKLYGCTCAKAV